MICFLVCRDYEFTLKVLLKEPRAPQIAIRRYDEVLLASELPFATYVFTDLDRLGVSDLVAAARLFRRLLESGCRVLNDPARARNRFSLLRSLYRNGLNPFNVYSLEEGHAPERFPVFLRIAEEHSVGPLTDLIWDQGTLERAIEAALKAGHPSRTLMLIEYAAAPARDGIFRKLSVLRVDDQYLPHVSVHDSNWIVKHGRPGIASVELYDEELTMLRTNPFADTMKNVFENAEIHYGRVDFGLVDNEVCVYEINTNPTIGRPHEHPVPQRMESMELGWKALLSALSAIDEPSDPTSRVDVSGESIAALSDALKIYPTLGDGFLRLSKEHSRRGDRSAAIQSVKDGMSRTPGDVKLMRQLSELSEDSDELHEAIKFASRAIELDPYNPELFYHKARLELRAAHGEAALEAIHHAISLQPSKKKYQVLRCRIRAFMAAEGNDLRKAIEFARSGEEIDPNDHELSYLVARLLLRADRGEEALTYLQAKLLPRIEGDEGSSEGRRRANTHPARGEYLLLLSQAHLLLGNMNAAVKAATCSVGLVAERKKSGAMRHLSELRALRRKRWLSSIKQYVLKRRAPRGDPAN